MTTDAMLMYMLAPLVGVITFIFIRLLGMFKL